MPDSDPRVAYFSMEIALESGLPTYSGGLGVLAGDTLRSCADLGVALCAATLVHRQGFGWSIGDDGDGEDLSADERDRLHANQLYEKLESVVVPCYYRERERFLRVMRDTIAVNASHFNTQRMVQEYLFEACQTGNEPLDVAALILGNVRMQLRGILPRATASTGRSHRARAARDHLRNQVALHSQAFDWSELANAYHDAHGRALVARFGA